MTPTSPPAASPEPPKPSALTLLLLAECASCRTSLPRLRPGLCPPCLLALAALAPGRVGLRRAPPGLPPLAAGGVYGGVLRRAVLAYKEADRRDLLPQLGELLAGAVIAHGGASALVPVPTTFAGRRRRGWDHLAPLAKAAARRLGVPVLRVLRARGRADSAGLGRDARLRGAVDAFAPRWGARRRLAGLPETASLVLVDDVATTGATLAAASRVLAGLGRRPVGAAVVAATPLWDEIHPERLRRSALPASTWS
ncbi:hypothetical protein Afil01_10540 [Actinorhabdospora filicis]|uniref:Phosphoribosyltransferase domain-containing protein n=1 Tax=Actinorhabdospora filicis TaxID=1785913 RepID=A0A9W6SI43_9ACTN|nr:phosphoribosyltransferase family protein [Actinorhabdospora filicis]GLZ76247.1 hypothetical protein Afil01_10540 [Actinorhabdospora filicis]